jgi:hypothetical protein
MLAAERLPPSNTNTTVSSHGPWGDYPADAEQCANLDAEAELFVELAGGGVDGWLVGLGHAAVGALNDR